MRVTTKHILVTFVIGLLAGGVCHADDEAIGAIFLSEPVGIRSTAMGDAFVAIAEDSETVYWNAAGMVYNVNNELLAVHTEYLQGFRNEFFAWTMPLSKKQSIGANLYLSYVTDLEKLVDLNSQPSTFSAYDTYLTLAWAYKFHPKMSVGVGLKGIYQTIDSYSGQSVALDLGYVSKNWLLHNLTLGISFRNIGLPIKFIETAYMLPMTVEGGASYRMFDNQFIVALDVMKVYQQEMVFKFGAEYNLEDIVSIRTGYKYAQYGNDLGELSGLTVGLGVELSDYKIDYAFAPYAELGNIHRIAVTFPFGKAIAEEEKMLKRLKKQLRTKQDKIVNGYIRKGNTYFKKKNYKKAIQFYEKALALQPSIGFIKKRMKLSKSRFLKISADKHFSDGKKAYARKDYLVALIEWNKVKELLPRYPGLGSWLKKVNNRLTAVQKNGTSKASKSFKRYIDIGLDYLRSGSYNNAIFTWKKILKADPGNARVKRYLAKTKKRMKAEISKRHEQAAKHWENDEQPYAVQLWRDILKINPTEIKAKTLLNQHDSEIQTLSEGLYRKGVQNYVTNQLVDAIANWTFVLMLDPENSKADKHLKRAKQKVKELESIQK